MSRHEMGLNKALARRNIERLRRQQALLSRLRLLGFFVLLIIAYAMIYHIGASAIMLVLATCLLVAFAVIYYKYDPEVASLSRAWSTSSLDPVFHAVKSPVLKACDFDLSMYVPNLVMYDHLLHIRTGLLDGC
jgi:hypothetical protein